MRLIKLYLHLVVDYLIPYKCYGYIQMMTGDCTQDQCNKCKSEYIKSIKAKYKQNQRGIDLSFLLANAVKSLQ